MSEGDVKHVVYWAYKTPARKTGVVGAVVPPKPAEKRKFPDCIGCWGLDEPHPSQRYHMQKGGCLYDEALTALEKWGLGEK